MTVVDLEPKPTLGLVIYIILSLLLLIFRKQKPN